MEQLISFGILLIIIGFIVLFIGIFMGAKETSKTKVAVGGFIGFIPFGFGTDKNLLWFVAITSFILFLVWLIFSFKFAR